MQEVLD